MTILNVLTVPNPNLRKVAEPITEITDEIRQQLKDMTETMYEYDGIGLAATQVDIHRAMFVIDPQREDERQGPMCILNPKVLESSEEKSLYEEGCLSIPEQFADIERPIKVKVNYMTETGEEVTEWVEGLFARIFQHELDHLNGVMFFDYISSVKRNLMVKKVQKYVKKMQSPSKKS